MDFKLISSAVGIGLVIIYAVGSGIWVSNSTGWYSSLIRPSWQPPDYVFGLIWPYNFVMLGISAYQVSNRLSKGLVFAWLGFFAISIVFALTWAYQFYVPHNLKLSAIALGLAALLTLPILLITYKASWKMGLLLTPYQIWVAIATTLAWGYALKN